MATLSLVRHRHADPACAMDVPNAFELGVMPGVLFVARAPSGLFSSSPFLPNVTVTAAELGPDALPEDLGEQALSYAERTLAAWRLIDRTDAELAGMPGERTLASYLVRPGSGLDLGRDVVVTVEQWRVVGDRLSWVVSGSSESLDYGQVADLWAAMAESLAVGERA